MELGLANIIGLYGLLALIPLIILYLRRPKPLDRIIPSLMFLIKENKIQRKFTFFKNLIRNFLLILQILTLIVLALSLAEPFADVPKNATISDSVIIIDGSASSQTRFGTTIRFDRAISLAKKQMKGKVSIILASNVPNTLLESGSKKDALTILNSLEPRDTPTNIEGAMIEAETILKKEKGNIYVISDFITTEETDQPIKAKRYLSAMGHNVEFLDVSSNASNIGIINLIVDKRETKVYIKNYNPQKVNIPVRLIVRENIIEEKTVEILPFSIETVSFKSQPSISKIELNINDDLDVDNIVYASTPPTKKIKILMITNADNTYLMSAIRASEFTELEIREPPIVKAFDLAHDIIIIDNVKESIVPSDLHDIAIYLEKEGKSLIITAQQEIDKWKLAELYPVEFTGVGNATKVCTKIYNYFTKRFEKTGGCFASLSRYYTSFPYNNTLVLVTADDNSPLLTISNKGKGNIVYYGILDDYSGFKSQEDYPIFWENLFNFLIESEDISEYNKRFDYKDVQNYDKIGIYDLGEIKVAVNLLNEQESDVSSENKIEEAEKGFILKSGEKSFNLSLVIPLIAMSSLLLLIEILYIKKRGDL